MTLSRPLGDCARGDSARGTHAGRLEDAARQWARCDAGPRTFQHFWDYSSSLRAQKFLAPWTTTAMRARMVPFKKFARTLRTHRRELLAWFAARGLFAHGATDGFNNKARITTRKAYGFRSYEHAEIACTTPSASYPSPTDSPTDSAEEAENEESPHPIGVWGSRPRQATSLGAACDSATCRSAD